MITTENLCNECPSHLRGKCCYIMVQLDAHTFTLSNHPCKYLNKKTGRCKVYKKRKETNPNCLTLEEMCKIGGLPKNCPYITNDVQYQARMDTREEITNFPKMKGQYNEFNDAPHKDIAVYETIRDHFCIKCKNKEIIEEWGDKFSILFFRYECKKCGHKWTTLKKQLKFTLKLISKSTN